jgi:hypothetical protein
MDEKVRTTCSPSSLPHLRYVPPIKAEVINCLLKKKSGTRDRRNLLASAEDCTPTTHTGNGTLAEGEVN